MSYMLQILYGQKINLDDYIVESENTVFNACGCDPDANPKHKFCPICGEDLHQKQTRYTVDFTPIGEEIHHEVCGDFAEGGVVSVPAVLDTYPEYIHETVEDVSSLVHPFGENDGLYFGVSLVSEWVEEGYPGNFGTLEAGPELQKRFERLCRDADLDPDSWNPKLTYTVYWIG